MARSTEVTMKHLLRHRSPASMVSFRARLLALAGLSLLGAASAQVPAPRSRIIRGMRYPAISPDGTRLAFSYRGDLWTVAAAGGTATRLAELAGWDVRPRWSPDGKTLAFGSTRNGNMDLYTVPAGGGEPRRHTFHTGADVLGGWSPDGKSLVFYTYRDSRSYDLYSIEVEGGRLRKLTHDEVIVSSPVWSPDGKSIAYNRGGSSWARKRLRSAAAADLWVLPLKGEGGGTPRRLTRKDSPELWPQYSPDGKSLFFVSDRDGQSTVWRMPARGGGERRVFHHPGSQIHYPELSRNGKVMVYEADFSLWTVDLSLSRPQPRRVEITAEVDDSPRVETRKLTSGATELEVSPDGSQLLLVLRNDLFVMPSSGGEARRLTDSLARDYDATWTPDGRHVVFVSEREANVDLYQVEVATGQTRRLTTDPQPDTSPSVSPDGGRIAFLRGANGREVRTLSRPGGRERLIAHGGFLGSPRWSPDSRWLAYSRRTPAAVTNVYVRPEAGGPEIDVTRWSGSNFGPVWSPDGKRLAFFSNRSGTTDLYTVELTRSGATVASGSGVPGSSPHVEVDATGIERRVRPLAARTAGSKRSLTFAPDGRSCLFTMSDASGVWSVPAAGGTATRVVENLGGTLRLSGDGSTLYALTSRGGRIQKARRSGGSPVNLSYTATVSIDPAEERRQAFDQAWRLLADYFYDPKMHGVNWAEIRNRYRPIVDECVTLDDFHLLLLEMAGELNASHTGVSQTRTPTGASDTAHLGVTFDWTHGGPGLKVREVLPDGPADTEPGRIQPGEYLLAVGGKDVGPQESFHSLLTGQAGKRLDVLVNTRPDRNGARTVTLTPIRTAAARDLVYERWVRQRREWVNHLSGGKLAYLHIRVMQRSDLARFERELLTEAHGRSGLVVDIRYNTGGRIHDELFALLTRKVHSFETPRSAPKMTQPFGAFDRPMILLINEHCFSDAEIFANGFRHLRLGKVVGRTTAGGVIGTGEIPLLDGLTTFRVPRTFWQTVDGTHLENHGVRPDIEVPLTPEDILTGRDPQLERAVKELLRETRRGGARRRSL